MQFSLIYTGCLREFSPKTHLLSRRAGGPHRSPRPDCPRSASMGRNIVIAINKKTESKARPTREILRLFSVCKEILVESSRITLSSWVLLLQCRFSYGPIDALLKRLGQTHYLKIDRPVSGQCRSSRGLIRLSAVAMFVRPTLI